MSIYPPVRGELARLLSAPRLDAYKAAVGGDVDDALRLYAWNLSVSTALFESVHYLEVAVRNTMDSSLSTWATAASGSPDPWYRNGAVALSTPSRGKVRQAVDRATDHGTRPEVSGRVVAELSLGFWWSLLAESYSRSLWQPCLRHAFRQARRGRLHDSLGEVLRLRNRIAHHEPVHQRDLTNDYVTILATAERITPRLAWWIDVTSRVPRRPAGTALVRGMGRQPHLPGRGQPVTTGTVPYAGRPRARWRCNAQAMVPAERSPSPTGRKSTAYRGAIRDCQAFTHRDTQSRQVGSSRENGWG